MHSSTARRLPAALLAVLALAATPTIASASGRTLADADYARAERFLGSNASPLVDHAVTRVTWLGDDRFWYRDHDASGDHFMVMGIGEGAKPATAFDHARLAEALSKATGKPVKADKLPVTSFTVAADGGYQISTRGKDYLCDAALKACAESAAKGGEEPGVRSPDGKSEAFVRDWNLWVRDVATGKETRLTRDGTTDYGYATDNSGWVHSDRAIVLWSPDSKRIATFQQDQRKTGSMTLVSTKVGHPDVQTWKYPFVGDKDITMIERVIVDAPTGKVLRLKMPPDQHRSTQCDDVSCFGGWEDVQWSADGKSLAFVSSSRDRLNQAKEDWIAMRFPLIPGDDEEFIPIPDVVKTVSYP